MASKEPKNKKPNKSKELPALFTPVPVNPNGDTSNEAVSAPNAFVALSLGIMQEHFMSGDTKYFLFLNMGHNLEKMGYSKEAINDFFKLVDKARAAFTTRNDFMG